MSVILTLISLGIAALVAFYILKEVDAAKAPASSDDMANLSARKLKLIENLRELELDRKTEKLTSEDYERLKLHTHHELSAVLKELDKHA